MADPLAPDADPPSEVPSPNPTASIGSIPSDTYRPPVDTLNPATEGLPAPVETPDRYRTFNGSAPIAAGGMGEIFV